MPPDLAFKQHDSRLKPTKLEAAQDEMKDLYRRLGAFGFDQAFIKQFILPDWWDDFSLTELADPLFPYRHSPLSN